MYVFSLLQKHLSSSPTHCASPLEKGLDETKDSDKLPFQLEL